MLFKRSLLRELVVTAIGAFVVLLGIVLAQRVAYYIGIAARGSLASDAINTLLGFTLLRYLPMLLSLTLFLAVLLTLTRWHRDSPAVCSSHCRNHCPAQSVRYPLGYPQGLGLQGSTQEPG